MPLFLQSFAGASASPHLDKPRALRTALRSPVALVFWVAFAGAAQAQAPLADLPSLMRDVVTLHPDVRTRQSDAQAAGFELEAARWGRYPGLTTELETQPGGVQAIARLEQPLWTGGLVQSRIDLASARLGGSQAAITQTQQDLLQRTATAFFEIVRLNARQQIAQANEAEHQRLMDIIQRRVQAEVSPATDQTQAQARLQQATTERLQVQRLIDATRLTLNELVGRTVGDLAPPQSVVLSGWDEHSLVQAALRYSPERQRLLAQSDLASAEIGVARAQFMPRVVLGYQARLGQLPVGGDRGRAYIAMQLQTGAGLSSLAGVQVAESRRQSSLDAIEAHDRVLAQQVRSLWAERSAILLQLEPVRGLLTASNDIVASYLRQFQVGRKNWLDVLNAQRESTQARYSLADLEAPLLRIETQLLIFTGHINANQTLLTHVR